MSDRCPYQVEVEERLESQTVKVMLPCARELGHQFSCMAEIPPGFVAGCPTCEEPGTFKPRHDGSKRCQSGSIASGGRNAHCTCDTCF